MGWPAASAPPGLQAAGVDQPEVAGQRLGGGAPGAVVDAGEPAQGLLGDAVFQAVEGDDAHPPAGLQARAARATALASRASSPFTAMRMAWKVRVAGSICFLRRATSRGSTV